MNNEQLKIKRFPTCDYPICDMRQPLRGFLSCRHSALDAESPKNEIEFFVGLRGKPAMTFF